MAKVVIVGKKVFKKREDKGGGMGQEYVALTEGGNVIALRDDEGNHTIHSVGDYDANLAIDLEWDTSVFNGRVTRTVRKS